MEARKAGFPVPTLQSPAYSVALGYLLCLSDLYFLVDENVVLCLTHLAGSV